MAEQIAKMDVVARVDDERTWWENILSKAVAQGIDEVGVTEKWSFKDLVGHMNGWQRRTLNRLSAIEAGQSEPPSPWPAEFDAIEDDDEAVERVNDWIYEQNRDRSADDVLAESRAQWDELRSIVASAQEEDLNDPARFAFLEDTSLAASILDGSYFSHYHEEHEPMIEAWLDRTDPLA